MTLPFDDAEWQPLLQNGASIADATITLPPTSFALFAGAAR
jgi:hypothetical protein